MNKVIANWIKSSEYDIKTAEAMYKARRFVYVIFMCHLAVEKSLKAIVAKNTKSVPPKTHDLFYLVKLASLEVPDLHKPILMHLNEASVPTRYPEDINKLIKVYNGVIANRYLRKTKGLLKWLKVQAK
ncbi:MAG: HEPN domain-containing protein [Candidatus Omnitrophica bacterium]|nr:HEPN domain-containing protein [Candidatus Omnitrophota bacterium]MBU4479529.1 HEPN domain-containing protein [Candidatus Omnitrophota bacterium]